MKNQKSVTKEMQQMNASLEPLGIRQIEERLEVSSLAPHGGIVESNWFDGENCCHDKCSGNEFQMDDPMDTGEITGGRGV